MDQGAANSVKLSKPDDTNGVALTISIKLVRQTSIPKVNFIMVDIDPKNPRLYVSLGTEWREFPSLVQVPFYEKKRWLHFNYTADIHSHIYFTAG
ncbi:hypothetical protein [Peribacillus sp. ACCC06369]|uniref:hypothetical protein n=1 Tax=Peribacillus sp. ACCC06369 TaxID=3055860 RepID=UPI0025A0ECA7|nr:hypothetical protein [Peribacillus sp. ACCC06369]MDM5356379.1 hypothetical protein [Peribacillus sp. ACCC06369]